MRMLKWLVNCRAKWVSSEVGRRGVSRFSRFFLDSGWSYLVGRNRSCTALHRSTDRESNDKPARVSGDKLVKFIKLFDDIFSQLLPWQRRQKCLLVFFMLNRIWISQAHRITVVALHLGVFQGIVIFLREALWQRVSKNRMTNFTKDINRLI